MKFGVATSIYHAELIADAGFDFIDLFAQDAFYLSMPDEIWKKSLKRIKNSPIPVLAVAGIFPGDIRIVGPEADADFKKNLDYMCRLMDRVSEAEIPTLVFGSNQARKIPDGFDPATGARQIEEFLNALLDYAERCGIDYVIEPLRADITNTFTNLASAATLMHRIHRKNLGLLVDFIHFKTSDNDYASLYYNAPLLRHTHISTMTRGVPGEGECDFSQYMHVLKAGGCDSRISIEARDKITEVNAAPALKTLKDAWEKA